MYHIIQTIENGRKCLSIVPSNWMKDGNLDFFYWPPQNATKLSKKKCNVDETSWKLYEVDRNLSIKPFGNIFYFYITY
jgi:hypothetical protein